MYLFHLHLLSTYCAAIGDDREVNSQLSYRFLKGIRSLGGGTRHVPGKVWYGISEEVTFELGPGGGLGIPQIEKAGERASQAKGTGEWELHKSLTWKWIFCCLPGAGI